MSTVYTRLILIALILIITFITCTQCFAIDIKTIAEGTYKGKLFAISADRTRKIIFGKLLLLVANGKITGFVHHRKIKDHASGYIWIFLPEDNAFFVKYKDPILKLSSVDIYDNDSSIFEGITKRIYINQNPINKFKGLYKGGTSTMNISSDGSTILFLSEESINTGGIYFGKIGTDGKFTELKRFGKTSSFAKLTLELKLNDTYILTFKSDGETKSSIELKKVQ